MSLFPWSSPAPCPCGQSSVGRALDKVGFTPWLSPVLLRPLLSLSQLYGFGQGTALSGCDSYLRHKHQNGRRWCAEASRCTFGGSCAYRKLSPRDAGRAGREAGNPRCISRYILNMQMGGREGCSNILVQFLANLLNITHTSLEPQGCLLQVHLLLCKVSVQMYPVCPSLK